MAESRLSEAEAEQRCQQVGLVQVDAKTGRPSKPYEVYRLWLVTHWKMRQIADYLGMSDEAAYKAKQRAEEVVKLWEGQQAEKRWREMHEKKPGGMRIDCCTLDGVNGRTIEEAKTVMELMQNGQHGGSTSSGLFGKEGATVHIGKMGRAKRVTVECIAQLLAGTLRKERTLFPKKRASEFEYPVRRKEETS